MSQFHVLAKHEVSKFNQPPRFDKNERMAVFTIDTRTIKILQGLKKVPENKVGFMILSTFYRMQ